MKRQSIYLLILTALYLIVYWFSFDSKLDINGDNATFLHLAKNIAEGYGFSDVNATGVKPTNFYPPAYPGLLSLFLSAEINSLFLFKLLDGLFLFLSITGLFFVIKGLTKNQNLAFVIAIITVFSAQLMHFSNIVMSEMFYVFWTTICFLSLYKYAQKGKTTFWKSPYFYGAVVSSVMAYHTRTIGLTIIFGMTIFFLFRKEWKTTAVSLLSIALLSLPWIIRNSAAGLGSRYLGPIMTINNWRPEEGQISSVGQMIDKIIANFDEIVIKGIKEILFPFVTIDYQIPSGFMAIVWGFVILGILVYGAWNLGKLKWFFISYLIANIGLLLLWNGGNGSRYITTIAPLLFVLFYVGIFNVIVLIFKPKEKIAGIIPFSFLVVVLLMLAPLKLQSEQAKMPYFPAYENYFKIAKTMEEKAPKSTIVCCRKTELFLFYAPSMYAVNYTYTLDPKILIQDLIAQKVDYVILEQLGYSSTYRYLLPAIQQNEELFQIFWQLKDPDTYLLKFDREKAIQKFGLKK